MKIANKARLTGALKTDSLPTRVYTDGSGSRPDGKGSGFAWLIPSTGEKKVVREDGLTNNQAEYRAILSALDYLPDSACAEILTDSENTCCQLTGQRRVLNAELTALHTKIHALIVQKKLIVEFTWVSRRDNLAGKLI